MVKDNQTVVAIVGVPGAGKTIAADYFRQKNIPVLRFGEVTDEGLNAQGLALTEGNERFFREKLRHELGMAAYAIKMEPKINYALKSHDFIVIDGLRSWEEYLYLKDKFRSLILLAIYAAPSIRYMRLAQRKKRRLTFAEARERDVAELTALNMGPPIAISDYLIKNESSKANFLRELDMFMEHVRHVE